MDAALVLDQVTKRYGAGAQATAALNGVSLTVPIGEFLSIMGASGSGKSTMLNLIAGLDTPTTGKVIVAGQNLAELSDDQRSDLRLRHIGIVFQSFNLLPTFTVRENIAWPLEFARVKSREAEDRVRLALDVVGLAQATHGRRSAELSGGEQQRVAIARALVIDPQVLLADEPTGNLDSQTGQVVLDLLTRLNRERGLTIVMVTHNALAATYGHRTVELRDGIIVRDVRAPRETSRVVALHD